MNAIDELLGPDVVYRLGWTLLHSLWQGAAVAAALLLALATLRRRTPEARYAAACAALALMLAGPMLTFSLLPEGRVRSGTAAAISPAAHHEAPAAEPPSLGPRVSSPQRALIAEEGPRSSSDAQTPVTGAAAGATSTSISDSTAGPAGLAQPLAAWLTRAVLLWIAGVLGLCVWNVGGWVAVQRLKRIGTAAAGEELVRRVAALAKRLRVSAPVRVVESALVDVPAVIGWLRPVLLVPASCVSGLSPRQLDAILAHELAHVRRHDYLVNLLQTVVETLLFFHPAVWWVSRWVRVERELCCDDAAVAACGDRFAYADALLEVARRQSAPRLALAATGPQGGRAGAGPACCWGESGGCFRVMAKPPPRRAPPRGWDWPRWRWRRQCSTASRRRPDRRGTPPAERVRLPLPPPRRRRRSRDPRMRRVASTPAGWSAPRASRSPAPGCLSSFMRTRPSGYSRCSPRPPAPGRTASSRCTR